MEGGPPTEAGFSHRGEPLFTYVQLNAPYICSKQPLQRLVLGYAHNEDARLTLLAPTPHKTYRGRRRIGLLSPHGEGD